MSTILQEIIEGCQVEAKLLKQNENSYLTINTVKYPIQIPWIGKKVGDLLTTSTGLVYRIEKIYIGEVNRIDQTRPAVLKIERKKPGKIHTSIKKKNHELNNEHFSYDISGFGMYLLKRGYSSFAESGANSTCIGYVDAITKICVKEKLTFHGLCEDISRFCKEYSLDGTKKVYGENGRGTWRNALNRLEEFVEYQKILNEN